MRTAALVFAALAAVSGAALAAAPPTSAPIPAAPTRWVEDHANFISPATRDALDARLEGYERATGHQIVVWIGDSIHGADLADWAVRTFAAWKVGRKGIDDGLVMFVLASDRQVDIEVGYGLEDRVPDAIASRIIREVMTPKLRSGDRDGAITDGVNALLKAIEGKPWAGGPATTTTVPPESRGPSLFQWIIGGLALVGFLIFAITHPRLAMFWLWTMMSGGRGGGWGGGSSWGGGGFGGGGFSGGGGSSGGGGARGGW